MLDCQLHPHSPDEREHIVHCHFGVSTAPVLAAEDFVQALARSSTDDAAEAFAIAERWL